MIEFSTKRVVLPCKPHPATWAYGTSVIALPDTQSVVLSLPSAGSRSPWCIVDLRFGHVTPGTSMPGPFRAMVAPEDGVEDRRPWVLGIYGVGRLDATGARPTVTDVVRKGIGTYPSTLVDYAPDILAIGHKQVDSVVLLSRRDGTRIKRLRASGYPAYRLPNGLLRMVAFHYGRACDVDTEKHRVVKRHELPYGAGSRLVGDGLITLVGERNKLRVFTAGGTEEVDFPGGWAVEGTELVVLDPVTLEVRHRATAPVGAVEVLGQDAAGRVVVSRSRGLSVLAAPTFAEVGSFDAERDLIGAGMVPGANLAAVIPNEREHDGLIALRW